VGQIKMLEGEEKASIEQRTAGGRGGKLKKGELCV